MATGMIIDEAFGVPTLGENSCSLPADLDVAYQEGGFVETNHQIRNEELSVLVVDTSFNLRGHMVLPAVGGNLVHNLVVSLNSFMVGDPAALQYVRNGFDL